jgi:hypothetical protein
LLFVTEPLYSEYHIQLFLILFSIIQQFVISRTLRCMSNVILHFYYFPNKLFHLTYTKCVFPGIFFFFFFNYNKSCKTIVLVMVLPTQSGSWFCSKIKIKTARPRPTLLITRLTAHAFHHRSPCQPLVTFGTPTETFVEQCGHQSMLHRFLYNFAYFGWEKWY